MPRHVLIVHGCFSSARADWSIFHRDLIATKPEVFTVWPFIEKFANLWFNPFLIRC